MIEIEDLRFRALTIPRLVISDGTTAVIGANGSWKTTLLRLVAGLFRPESGSITVDGVHPVPGTTGFVDEYPDRNVLFSRVADELAAPLRFCHISCSEVESRVKEAAATIGFGDRLHQTMDTLSGGEKVLIALLTSLITCPKTLVLDEFDSHLDYESLQLADSLIAGSGARTVVRCTQNMDLAARCGKVVFLHQGGVLHDGRPEEVFSETESDCFYPFSWRTRR